MAWNYRAVKVSDGEGDSVGIHEVYYDVFGKVRAWSREPVTPQGDTAEELARRLELMTKALEKPVLDEEELVREVRSDD